MFDLATLLSLTCYALQLWLVLTPRRGWLVVCDGICGVARSESMLSSVQQRVTLVCVPSARARAIHSLTLLSFARTDVLLACVRECVNVHAHTHYCWCRGCCYWSLCVCAPSEQHTYTNTLRHTTHNLRRSPLPLIADRVSFVFHFPINQPVSFHTSYHWAPFSCTVFRSRQSIAPLIGGHSHVRTHTQRNPDTQRPPSKDPPRLSCF